MQGKLPALPGELPGLGDFVDHVSTVFPEVRLKRYLEMRGADGGPFRRLCGVAALWVGLVYDELPLDAAWDLIKNWTLKDHQRLRLDVPRQGLDMPFHGRALRDVALDVLAMAREGLRRRARLSAMGEDESHFLDTLFGIAGSGRTLADELLDEFSNRWAGNIDPIFREHAY